MVDIEKSPSSIEITSAIIFIGSASSLLLLYLSKLSTENNGTLFACVWAGICLYILGFITKSWVFKLTASFIFAGSQGMYWLLYFNLGYTFQNNFILPLFLIGLLVFSYLTNISWEKFIRSISPKLTILSYIAIFAPASFWILTFSLFLSTYSNSFIYFVFPHIVANLLMIASFLTQTMTCFAIAITIAVSSAFTFVYFSKPSSNYQNTFYHNLLILCLIWAIYVITERLITFLFKKREYHIAHQSSVQFIWIIWSTLLGFIGVYIVFSQPFVTLAWFTFAFCLLFVAGLSQQPGYLWAALSVAAISIMRGVVVDLPNMSIGLQIMIFACAGTCLLIFLYYLLQKRTSQISSTYSKTDQN